MNLLLVIIMGAVYSSIYVMLAMGFSLVFGVARIFNLAYTAYFMLSAYFMVSLVNYGLGVPLAIVVTLALTTLIGLAIYVLLLAPLVHKEVGVLLVTIAIGMAIREMIILVTGGEYYGINPFIKGHTTILGTSVYNQHLLIIGVTVFLVVALWSLINYTKLGRGIRAISKSPELAGLSGVDPNRVTIYVMVISTLLVAVAGVFISPLFAITPGMWENYLFIAVAAVILGGFGSFKGSIVGGVIVGYVLTSVVLLVPQGGFLKMPVLMIILMCVLLVKPKGIFGVEWRQ